MNRPRGFVRSQAPARPWQLFFLHDGRQLVPCWRPRWVRCVVCASCAVPRDKPLRVVVAAARRLPAAEREAERLRRYGYRTVRVLVEPVPPTEGNES